MLLKKATLSTKFFLLLLLILSLNAAAYILILQNVYKEQLKSQAQTVVANVEAFGAWVATHGRVWTKSESENSYLSRLNLVNPNNPEETVSFFSKNPALAQREFSEAVAKSSSPAKFRMTSQNVMNPINKPDAFESFAMNEIRFKNKTEYFTLVNGEYRYAKAVYHTAGCIKCHGDVGNAPEDVISRYGNLNGFGFKEGEVAGVISVTIPAKPLLTTLAGFVGPKEIALILISLLLALWFIRSALITPIKKLTVIAEEISKGHDTSVPTDGIDLETRNEMDRLRLAFARMRNSTFLAIKKMREAKAEGSDNPRTKR